MIIESSPFLRTLQTASEISKVLGIKKIKTNFRLCETLDESNMKHLEDPLALIALKAN